MNNTVGNKIRKIRRSKGISQAEMAKHFKITQSNYGRMEKSDDRISVNDLILISKILLVSPFDLLRTNS